MSEVIQESISYSDKLHIYVEGNRAENLGFHDLKLELTSFDSLTFFGKSILVASLLTSLIVGSYFKSSLHLYMFDERKDIMNKPIDLLILVQSLIEHLVAIFMTAFYVVGVVFNITFADYFGENW